MRIRIISPGKIKEKWLQAGIDEYKKRLRRYCRIDIITVPDSPDNRPVDKILAEEGERIMARTDRQDWIIALDLNGEEHDSLSFASVLQKDLAAGGSTITFVIGGSNGLNRSILERANRKLCLSRLTFTHQMARLILLEQCYRAFRISSGEPYHK